MRFFPFKKNLNAFVNDTRGSMLMTVLVFGSVALLIITGISSYGLSEHRASNYRHNNEAALHMAEAGIGYYRWHLAHDADDFWDGNTSSTPGPYIHDVTDKDGNIIGHYALTIIPPDPGSSIVIIQSTGWSTQQEQSQRTIQVRMGKPALSDYTFLQHANMRFSPTTFVSGKIHSNGGVEFNGTTDSYVQSARETYDTGTSGVQNGVWGTGGPQGFWEFPVPPIDFNSVSADVSLLQELSQEPEGFYRPASGVQGWRVEFLANGTFNLYRVTSRVPYCQWSGACVQQWYDLGGTVLEGNYPIPENGAMFFEDDVWVNGVVNGRVTVVAARFPENPANYRDIYISGNITYATLGGDDVLGLIAQSDIIVPLQVPEHMTIHAAALAQYGQIYRPLYRSNYQNSLQESLTFFGSQISFSGGGWKWGTPPVSGFITTNHIYDGNLLYYVPPGFPTKETYELISWEEIEI